MKQKKKKEFFLQLKKFFEVPEKEIHKPISKRALFISMFLLVVLSLSTRFPNLLNQPPFGDEAIYLREANIIRENPKEWLFITAAEGKQPLFMWTTAFIGFSLFDDPFIAGRMVSAFAGLFSTLLIFLIALRLFGGRIAIFSSLFYIFSPYMLLHNRMAVVDSMLNMFCLLSILLTFLLIENKGLIRIPIGLFLGISMGCGFLTKSPAIGSIFCVGISILLFSKNRKSISLWLSTTLGYVTAFLVILPYFVFSPPITVTGGDKLLHQTIFFLSLSELIHFPYKIWIKTFFTVIDCAISYHNPFILGLIVLALLCLIIFPKRNRLFLGVFGLLPIFAIILVARSPFYRYFLYSFPPLYILSANMAVYFVFLIKKIFPFSEIKLGSIIVFLIIFPSFKFIYSLIFSFQNTPFLKQEMGYIEGTWSGYGTREAISFLKEDISKKKEAILLLPVDWGSPSDPIYLYFKKMANVKIYEAWWWPNKIPHLVPEVHSIEMALSKYQQKKAPYLLYPNSLKKKDVYFVTSSFYTHPSYVLTQNPEFRLIKSFSYPQHSINIYLRKATK